MSAIRYFFQGLGLIFQPGLRALALGPVLLNLILYIALGWYLVGQFAAAVDWTMNKIPAWLSFLMPVLWIFFSLSMLLVFGYSFAIIAGIIAAPFNGLLAEKVAEHTGKRSYQAPLNTQIVIAIIKRSLWREIVKLGYFIPRIIGVLVLSLTLGFIPVIGFFVSILAFIWAAWSMAIQFVDYPADNDGINFRQTIVQMKLHRFESICFGSTVTLLLGIPFLNLFVMPAAVAGATAFWLDKLADDSSDCQPST